MPPATHTCSHCGKTFPKKSNLRVHMRVHTKETPFDCQFCEKKFSWRSSWISHLAWHSGIAKGGGRPNPPILPNQNPRIQQEMSMPGSNYRMPNTSGPSISTAAIAAAISQQHLQQYQQMASMNTPQYSYQQQRSMMSGMPGVNPQFAGAYPGTMQNTTQQHQQQQQQHHQQQHQHQQQPQQQEHLQKQQEVLQKQAQQKMYMQRQSREQSRTPKTRDERNTLMGLSPDEDDGGDDFTAQLRRDSQMLAHSAQEASRRIVKQEQEYLGAEIPLDDTFSNARSFSMAGLEKNGIRPPYYEGPEDRHDSSSGLDDQPGLDDILQHSRSFSTASLEKKARNAAQPPPSGGPEPVNESNGDVKGGMDITKELSASLSQMLLQEGANGTDWWSKIVPTSSSDAIQAKTSSGTKNLSFSRIPEQLGAIPGIRNPSSNIYTQTNSTSKYPSYVGMNDSINMNRSRLSFASRGVKSTSIRSTLMTNDALYNLDVQGVQSPFMGRSIAEAPQLEDEDAFLFKDIPGNFGYSTAIGAFPTPLRDSGFFVDPLEGQNEGHFEAQQNR